MPNDMIHKSIWLGAGSAAKFLNGFSGSVKNFDGEIIRFNPSKNTDNLGDFIIMHYCEKILDELFPKASFKDVSVHTVPTESEENAVKNADARFVCGTNLLTSHIEENWNWRLPDGFKRKRAYKNVILLGVGWKNYEDECSAYSKMIYKSMLNPCALHSVRDSYTEAALKKAGIKNVINTGCPTMWRLTPEFCKKIPQEKARDVITTVTDYRKDVESDNLMLEILGKSYETVYLWLQGRRDEEYLNELCLPKNLVIIPRDLKKYEERLEKGNADYVGTRLHAGIHALNYGIRSLVIAVDNRALEIARDTALPILKRDGIKTDLLPLITERRETPIRVNTENIEKFKNQFKG
ncbi:MAG: polysaccharide pyruvyl transferase family protein [Oscillospiraceae bacterium]|nr:polysaccharide pyruvyl transferase family protein [Oscillospiraceae bacterium]